VYRTDNVRYCTTESSACELAGGFDRSVSSFLLFCLDPSLNQFPNAAIAAFFVEPFETFNLFFDLGYGAVLSYIVAMRWGDGGKPTKFPWKILVIALLTLLILYCIER
jgi:hypothetical protein